MAVLRIREFELQQDRQHMRGKPTGRKATYPNLVHSCWIWTASSRVGARMRAIGPSPGWRRGCLKKRIQSVTHAPQRLQSTDTHALMCNMAGNAKEIVLPEPVWAIATRSRPLRAMGHDWHWMGVGAGKP